MKRAMFPIPNELDCDDQSSRARWLCRNVNVFLDGVQQSKVAHYNIAEGWITYLRISGYARFAYPNRTTKRKGKIEVKYKDDVAEWRETPQE